MKSASDVLVHQIRMRNLQRDVDAFECVERAEHRGERADRELRQQSVFAKFLSSAEHEKSFGRSSELQRWPDDNR